MDECAAFNVELFDSFDEFAVERTQLLRLTNETLEIISPLDAFQLLH